MKKELAKCCQSPSFAVLCPRSSLLLERACSPPPARSANWLDGPCLALIPPPLAMICLVTFPQPKSLGKHYEDQYTVGPRQEKESAKKTDASSDRR